MITIVKYDERWPVLFEQEKARLRDGLGATALRIEHVGSTAVPGLSAKPVIDIQVSVLSLEPHGRYAPEMSALGYSHVALDDFDLVYPFFQRPEEWPTTHHVHLCAVEGELEWRHLLFRDYLRANPSVAAEYASLKRELAGKYVGTTLESREEYSLSKSDFVAEVLRKAKAEANSPRAIG